MLKVTAQYLKPSSVCIPHENQLSLMEGTVSTIICPHFCSSGLYFEAKDRHWFVEVWADRMGQKGIILWNPEIC